MVYKQDKYKAMIADFKEFLSDEQKDDLEYKAERKKLLQKLKKLGVGRTGSYLELLENNQDISNARILDALNSYKKEQAAGKKLDAGWLRKLIDEDYHFIDHVNEIQEREQDKLKEKLNAQKNLDEAMAAIGLRRSSILGDEVADAEEKKNEVKEYSEAEKNELRSYFMDLSFLEKNTIIEELRSRSDILRWKVEQKKGFEDMWDDVSMQILLIRATAKLKSEKNS